MFPLDELRMMWFKAYAIKWLLPLFPWTEKINKHLYFIAKHSQTNDLLHVYRLIYLEGRDTWKSYKKWEHRMHMYTLALK